jgi:hypothetical protein
MRGGGHAGGQADEQARSLSPSRTLVTPTASASPLAQDNTSRVLPPLCSISRQPIWAGTCSDNFTRRSRDPMGSKRRQRGSTKWLHRFGSNNDRDNDNEKIEI